MHSLGSDQHSAPAHANLPIGHDSRSVCSETGQQFSTDPHERYHIIHKEFQERVNASNQSVEGSHISFPEKKSRPSISGNRPQAAIGFNDNERDLMMPNLLDNDRNDECDDPPYMLSSQKLDRREATPGTSFKSTISAESIEKTWPDFMNKNEDDVEYAIEILKGPPDYYKGSNTLRNEKVEKLFRSAAAEGLTPSNDGIDAFVSLESRKDSTPPASNYLSDTGWIPDRIRINSSIILNVLDRIDQRIDPTEPTIMLRPFKFLVHYEKEIRDGTHELDRRSARTSSVQSQNHTDVNRHMACLVRFMDRYLSPTLKQLADNSTTKIAFRDLWYIFQPGVDISMPLRVLKDALTTDKKDATPQVFRDRYQMLWRISGVGGGRPRLSDTQESYDGTGIKCTAFAVNAFYIDFDGKYFLPTHHTFFIHPFEGVKEITSLDFYPARFQKDGQSLIREHASFGEQIFRTVTEGRMHFYYSGYTMVTHPCGCAISDEGMHQEAVDSEVIVDTKAALLQNPSWQPQANLWKPPPIQPDELKERHVVNTWSTSDSKKIHRSGQDYVFDDNEVDLRRALVYRDNTRIFKPIPSAWGSNARMVPEEDFHIFPGRVFAFVLRTRSFAPLWIWDLTPMKQQRESLNRLQLRDNTSKDVLTTLVECHFDQLQNNPDFEYDVIRGKCKGLIILFHGVAGTGKTSTAESIAAAIGKPLFQITCGDLGTQPNEVEKALKEIFRFAQQWGCILLLDECEIFLSRRTRNDITHNALVSVFLRTLELYTGVLFLTTNRVGVLDDAIISRLTWSSYYPPLNLAQSMKIWETQIRLLRERRPEVAIDEESILKFANRHFELCSAKECTWNGREIQNAFKVAVSLAEKSQVKDKDDTLNTYNSSEIVRHPRPRPKLRAKHFKIVAKNTSRFHEYFRRATGYTEKERAFNAMERADDWTTEDTDSDLAYQNGYKRKERRVGSDAGIWQAEPASPGTKSMKIPKQRRGSLGTNGPIPTTQRASLPRPLSTRQSSGHPLRLSYSGRGNSAFANDGSLLTASETLWSHVPEQVFGDMDFTESDSEEN